MDGILLTILILYILSEKCSEPFFSLDITMLGSGGSSFYLLCIHSVYLQTSSRTHEVTNIGMWLSSSSVGLDSLFLTLHLSTGSHYSVFQYFVLTRDHRIEGNSTNSCFGKTVFFQCSTRSRSTERSPEPYILFVTIGFIKKVYFKVLSIF